ncbi:restriction endonuclease [Saccharospirillum mangrovi]|uniref:restriction endonuclease n=1 Tax=Saccharospirillum mangrovi TaxID=2161747 RepID=UPI000D38E574|nr:restriction endonuclease [Saccharospirillum mangrovi]
MDSYEHLPKYDDLFIEILRYLNDHGPLLARELERPLADRFQLTDADLSIEYPSGNGTVFSDRLTWSLSHLVNSGLAERPKRGHCQITVLGQEYLAKTGEIKTFVKQTIAEKTRQRQRELGESKSLIEDSHLTDSDKTPQESLLSAYHSIQATVCEQILETILGKSPYEFEKLVIKLLGRMGYGGKTADSLLVTQKSNDGGIDGVIKEDVLGLGRIHLQAKRYRRDISIGREDIQRFVGALAVAQSQKGVFITTSYFTKGALEYAQSLNGATTLVLIDGERLAQYLYDYGVGMQEEQTLVLKKMDTDFWDEMLDDK